MKKQQSLLLFSVVCMVLALLVLPFTSVYAKSPQKSESKKAYNWKFQQCLPPASAATKNHPYWIKMIERNTGGRVKIKEYPVGSLVSQKEMLNACGTGVLEMVATNGGWWAGTIPVAAVESGLPFSYQNRFQVCEILWDWGLEEVARKEYAKHGVHLLTSYSTGGDGFGITVSKEINTLADFKGVKIRGFSMYLEFLKRMGASPVSMALPETYMALTTGTVDGAITQWEGQLSFKFYEPCKYGILPSLGQETAQNILINLKLWESLPDDLKTIIHLTVKNWASWQARYYEPRFLSGHIKKLEKLGMKFITLPDADQARMLEIALAIWDDHAKKDPAAAEGVKILKDYFKDIGRFK